MMTSTVDDGDFMDDALVTADDEVAGFALDAMDVQSGETRGPPWGTSSRLPHPMGH